MEALALDFSALEGRRSECEEQAQKHEEGGLYTLRVSWGVQMARDHSPLSTI